MTTSTSHNSTTDGQPGRWERRWSEVTGAAGEIVWDAHETDLTADIEVFTGAFARTLPVIDLGCGEGRQTRFLAHHFQTVIGVDISPAAVERARGAPSPSSVRYRVLDARSPGQAETPNPQVKEGSHRP